MREAAEENTSCQLPISGKLLGGSTGGMNRIRQGKDVADHLVPPAAVGQYETGAARPRPDLVPHLAKVLDVPVGFFIAVCRTLFAPGPRGRVPVWFPV